jgi:hypothetical protein
VNDTGTARVLGRRETAEGAFSGRRPAFEKLGATVDFELFRPVLTKALGGSDPLEGRPAWL